MDKTAPGLSRRSFMARGSAAFAAAAFARVRAESQTASGDPKPSAAISGTESLASHAKRAGLLFGFAVNAAMVQSDEAYRNLVRQQCSILVADNAMKWRALRPAADKFFFDQADALVDFAERNGIKVRGHNLCWHQSQPAWFDEEATTGNARELLLAHIRTVAGRYAGRIHSWDVVNEAIDVKDGLPNGMRNSPWLRLAGPDYVDVAFRAAREADPKAILTYNEYGFEEESADAAAKRAATLQLLRGMRQRNVPLDAVGIQSHLKASRTYGPGLKQFLDECAKLKLRVYLTELDVNDGSLPAEIDPRDRAVAGLYRSYLGTALAASQVDAVLTWGVDDAHTWLNGIKDRRADGLGERPLLFDGAYGPTLAFFATRDAFDARRRS